MTDRTTLSYLFDPMCGWCYGAAPMLEQIATQGGFTVELAPTGLFAGTGSRPMDDSFAAFAWANDQRIQRLSGQEFSEDYRHRVLGDRTRLLDSGPAILALTAVALSAPTEELKALKAIQHARYVEGRDTTDLAILAEILAGLRLETAAAHLRAPDDALLEAYRARITQARKTAHAVGSDGVPALVVGAGAHRRLIKTNALFAGLDTLIAELQAA